MGCRVASHGSESHPSFLYSPAEDSLKDGHHLKQLLLKALTLMLDAAESYAKVTMESYSRLALGLGACVGINLSMGSSK